MIPCSNTVVESHNWQQELAASFTGLGEFMEFLGITLPDTAELELATSTFPFRVTRFYAGLMEKNNPRDPLLLQALPALEESRPAAGYSLDPLGDLDAHRGAGLLQKYRGRVLLIASAACAINCRYCFRRHFPYSDHSATRSNWADTLALLASRPDIKEVILSGGDPLTLSNERLGDLLEKLSGIPHLRRLRLHTRLPVVLPRRVDRELVLLLGSSRLSTSMVIHANHPREVSPELADAMRELAVVGVTLLNQSVLLRGINDSSACLQELSESLYDIGVLPYYIHMLDKVAGAGHFAVSRKRARQLHQSLQEYLPGYLLPRLVFEVAGATSKIAL